MISKCYNHIEYFVDTNDDLISAIGSVCLHHANHEPSELDGKQNHTRLDYYGYDGIKFSPARTNTRRDFPEHSEDLEHDQTRHKSIHSHGRGQTS